MYAAITCKLIFYAASEQTPLRERFRTHQHAPIICPHPIELAVNAASAQDNVAPFLYLL